LRLTTCMRTKHTDVKACAARGRGLPLAHWQPCSIVQCGRGKTQLHTLLDATFTGHVTSDRLTTYNSLPLMRRQVCWAHLIRNLRRRVEARGRWRANAADRLTLADLVLAVWDRYRAGVIDREMLHAMLAPIHYAV
ncbi:MAG: IS66 family transposase, partial [Roseiflexus sp.]